MPTVCTGLVSGVIEVADDPVDEFARHPVMRARLA
jgi:hypothetical protein